MYPRQAQKTIFFVHSFIIIFRENKYFKKPHPFARLIKGIVLGQTL